MECRWNPDFDAKFDDYNRHILGAAGELAAAQALGIPFDATCNTFNSFPDLHIGELKIQVRTRNLLGDGRLFVRDYEVRDAEKREQPFVCVQGLKNEFEVKGWRLGKHCEKPEWKAMPGNKPPAIYLVPDNQLEPIQLLREHIYRLQNP